LTANSNAAITSVKLAIRSYLASESGARDVISTLFTVLNQDLEGSASVMNALVDILEDEEKRKNLLSAWNGFKIEVGAQWISAIGAELITSNDESFQISEVPLRTPASQVSPVAGF
jgi:hypothetical protein